MLRLALFACCLLAAFCVDARAQSNELSVGLGGGGLASGDGSGRTVNLTYSRLIGEHFAAEGSFDVFYVDGDDIGSVQGSVLYHFVPSSDTRRLIPYVTAGVGSASTDFTEIRPDLLLKVGGGVKYFPIDRVGVRFEVRDEIVDSRYAGVSTQHFLSARVGVVFRF